MCSNLVIHWPQIPKGARIIDIRHHAQLLCFNFLYFTPPGNWHVCLSREENPVFSHLKHSLPSHFSQLSSSIFCKCPLTSCGLFSHSNTLEGRSETWSTVGSWVRHGTVQSPNLVRRPCRAHLPTLDEGLRPISRSWGAAQSYPSLHWASASLCEQMTLSLTWLLC